MKREKRLKELDLLRMKRIISSNLHYLTQTDDSIFKSTTLSDLTLNLAADLLIYATFKKDVLTCQSVQKIYDSAEEQEACLAFIKSLNEQVGLYKEKLDNRIRYAQKHIKNLTDDNQDGIGKKPCMAVCRLWQWSTNQQEAQQLLSKHELTQTYKEIERLFRQISYDITKSITKSRQYKGIAEELEQAFSPSRYTHSLTR